MQRRLALSIGSIKRAEAGKNVLYRTALQFAQFYNIPLEDIVDDIPLEVWEYSQRQQQPLTLCLGRDWELYQLKRLARFKEREPRTIYLSGGIGSGKTALVKQFLLQSNLGGRGGHYHNCCSPLPVFWGLAGIESNWHEERVRLHLQAFTNSTLVYLTLLTLFKVNLSSAEHDALKYLSVQRQAELTLLSILSLLDNCKRNGNSIFVLDNIDRLSPNDRKLLDILVAKIQSYHIQLILTFRGTPESHFQIKPSTPIHHFHLYPLDSQTIRQIAQRYVFHSNHQITATRIDDAIKSSAGFPGLVTDIMQQSEPECFIPNRVQRYAEEQYLSLNQCERKLLETMVSSGSSIDLFQVEQTIAQEPSIGIHSLLSLEHRGLIQRENNRYRWSHPLVQAALQSLYQNRCFADWTQEEHTQRRA